MMIQKSRRSLAVKVARIARDLKPEVNYTQMYNNAANAGTIGTCNLLGVTINGATGLGNYTSSYLLCAINF